MAKHPGNRYFKPLLPPWEEFSQSEFCRGANSTIKCFLAGDGRVNENLGLTCLHTSFTREHNRIESYLHRINPHWSGNRLYFETRRIIGAMWQHIVYSEYLPTVLGPYVTGRYGLDLQNQGYRTGYEKHVKVDVSNSFATAAFRFGHSQIQSMMHMRSNEYVSTESLHLSNMFRNPGPLYDGRRSVTDDILRGLMGDHAQTVDPNLSQEIVGKLFSERPPLGLGTDLAALNIQRGREHGIPGYVAWREKCGLGRPTTFSELIDYIPQSVVDKFTSIYRHVDDIDLFPAGISETHVQGSAMGPTFACIISEQFKRTRDGDRFWYESGNNTYPFTSEQLREIRKASLAKIICENSDNITHIQPRVLLVPFSQAYKYLWNTDKLQYLSQIYPVYNGAWNERKPCSHLQEVDLSAWRDSPKPETRPSESTSYLNYLYSIMKNIEN